MSDECKNLVHNYKIMGEQYSIESLYDEFFKKTKQ